MQKEWMSSLMRSLPFTSHTYYYDLYIYHTYNDLVEKAGVLEERLRVETPAESGDGDTLLLKECMTSLMRSWSFTSHTHYDPYIYTIHTKT